MLALPRLITALVWAVLVVVPLCGLAMMAMPLVLDWAQVTLRTRPPTGTPAARRVWYRRESVYQAIFAVLAALGGLVFLLAWLKGPVGPA